MNVLFIFILTVNLTIIVVYKQFLYIHAFIHPLYNEKTYHMINNIYCIAAVCVVPYVVKVLQHLRYVMFFMFLYGGCLL